MRSSLSFLGASLLATLLIGAGCSSKTSSTTSTTPPSAGGSAYGGGTIGARIPDNFPSDIPRYPGEQVIIASVFDNTATLTAETNDSKDKAIVWVNQQFQTQGATLQNRSDEGISTTFIFMKANVRYTVRLDANSGNAGTGITITREMSN